MPMHLQKVLTVLFSAASTCYCAPIQWPTNGHYYEAIDSPASWLNAQAAAVARGGYLATITSQAEQDFVFANFGGVRRFIGLNDIASEGNFVWVTGEPFAYSHWASGEPNNFNNGGEGVGEDVAELRADGLWNDVPTTLGGAPFQLQAVFEFDTLPVPEPGTTTLLCAGLAALLVQGTRRRGVH